MTDDLSDAPSGLETRDICNIVESGIQYYTMAMWETWREYGVYH